MSWRKACKMSLFVHNPYFFLSSSGGMCPLHTSAEACLTGWPNAQPRGRASVLCRVSLSGWYNGVCVKCNAVLPLFS